MRLMDVNWQQTNAPLAAYEEEDRLRLGRLLRARRGQLGAHYRTRQAFAQDVGLKETLLADLENAKRENFTQETLAAAEQAYRLSPGSFRQVLDDPSLTEFPHRLGGATIPVTLRTSVGVGGDLTGAEKADDLIDQIIANPPDDAPDHVRDGWAQLSRSLRHVWWTPDCDVTYRAAMTAMLATLRGRVDAYDPRRRLDQDRRRDVG